MSRETRRGVVHQVGVKELRENLAHWLDLAATGEDVIVTERGRSKVRITDASPHAILEQLAREGKVRLPTKPWRPIKPVPNPGGGSPLTDEILRGHGH